MYHIFFPLKKPCLLTEPACNIIRKINQIDRIIYSDIEHIWQMSWRTTFYRGGPVFMSALSGIDIALWDLKGEPATIN